MHARACMYACVRTRTPMLFNDYFDIFLSHLSPEVVSQGNYMDPHCGGKQVIVRLFEWKWTDIAEECERILGPKGFCGVQVRLSIRRKSETEF